MLTSRGPKGRLDGDPRLHSYGEQVREAGGKGDFVRPSIDPEEGTSARANRNGGPNPEYG